MASLLTPPNISKHEALTVREHEVLKASARGSAAQSYCNARQTALTATILSPFKDITKVAAFGRAISFVDSFFVGVNRLNINAVSVNVIT